MINVQNYAPCPDTGVTWDSGCQPTPKRPLEPTFPSRDASVSVFHNPPASTGNGAFQSCQAVTVVDSLYYQLVIIQLLFLWNGVHEISADMCPAKKCFMSGTVSCIIKMVLPQLLVNACFKIVLQGV